MTESDTPFTDITISVPLILLHYINAHNRAQSGPDGFKINITQTCIDSLRDALKKVE